MTTCKACGTRGDHSCPSDRDRGETEPTFETHVDECRECTEDALCPEGRRLATRERLEREAAENARFYERMEEF